MVRLARSFHRTDGGERTLDPAESESLGESDPIGQSLRRDLFAALKDATALGGLLVFESFTRLQVELPRGPSDPEHTLEAGELRRGFADFEILDYREKTFFPEDVQKTRAMASLVARRPDR